MNTDSASRRFTTLNPSIVKNIYIYIFVCVFLLVSIDVSGRSSIDELYSEVRSLLRKPIDVEYSVISDFEVSDSDALEYVSTAIFSDDAEKIDEVLVELINYARSVNSHRWLNAKPPPIRNFSSEPSLRDFLIQFWFFQREQLEAEMEWYEKPHFPWTGIPKILAGLFPTDPKVYDFIWSIQNSSKPTEPAATLMLLDSGGFQTQKANELRMATLLSDRPFIFNYLAARSLGRFQSPEGFETLLTTLRDSDNRSLVSLVCEAIILYGYSVLPYAQEIQEVAERFGVDENTESKVLPDAIFLRHHDDLTIFGEDASTNRFVKALKDLDEMAAIQVRYRLRTLGPHPRFVR